MVVQVFDNGDRIRVLVVETVKELDSGYIWELSLLAEVWI